MKAAVYLLIATTLVVYQNSSAQQMPFKDKSRYVIFPFDQKTTWCFSKGKQTTLDKKELQKLGEILKRAAGSSSDDGTNVHYQLMPLNKYYFQLVPIINDKGEKEVWINGLCEVIRNDWRTNVIAVMDGGNCYFTIKINLTRNSFYELLINGDA